MSQGDVNLVASPDEALCSFLFSYLTPQTEGRVCGASPPGTVTNKRESQIFHPHLLFEHVECSDVSIETRERNYHLPRDSYEVGKSRFPIFTNTHEFDRSSGNN